MSQNKKIESALEKLQKFNNKTQTFSENFKFDLSLSVLIVLIFFTLSDLSLNDFSVSYILILLMITTASIFLRLFLVHGLVLLTSFIVFFVPDYDSNNYNFLNRESVAGMYVAYALTVLYFNREKFRNSEFMIHSIFSVVFVIFFSSFFVGFFIDGSYDIFQIIIISAFFVIFNPLPLSSHNLLILIMSYLLIINTTGQNHQPYIIHFMSFLLFFIVILITQVENIKYSISFVLTLLLILIGFYLSGLLLGDLFAIGFFASLYISVLFFKHLRLRFKF